ncbi:sigma-54-dependent Fis family transcriptional regulator [Arachidicoccus ginsenosidimutans]|uniref:sigma-54-dependent transcriptional regulator n=1 Tax=Arachidicoccus sp. BS20 TaxID=1850526 RepID=UPI0007F0DF06|nr:sigma-54 dependent transcriptional regulator [Arachidicoccus sp. BS20]ANI89877.1 sigma-54-dependent Fis family transcriptional regulator [Arachidicoccus sp. BS20]
MSSLKRATVMVVDDDTDVLTAVRLLLRPEVKEIITEKNPELLLSVLEKTQVDLLFLDMNYKSAVNTGNEGIYWLQKIKKLYPDLPIVMITAYADIDLAVKSLKLGATDFMVKPWQNDRLLESIKSIYKNSSLLRNADEQRAADNKLIGNSAVMQDVFYKLEKIAPTDANILILGENGTGKDLIAEAIHRKSLRGKQPYIKVDVGALTESLFESELFGHKKGAFTDAREDRTGRFEEANNGTLFLDEIGNISLAQQSRLLTVLQSRYIIPLGSNQKTDLNIRLICATNVPLNVLGDERKFRKDLIYRINTVEINVPPLRERFGDIPLLAEHFAKIYGEKYGKLNIGFSKEAMLKMELYHFPGNVRELQYAVERAVIMNETNEIEAREIIFSPIENMYDNVENKVETNLVLVERNAILKAIERRDGNISKAAKDLGITRAALYRKLNKHEI